MERSGNSIQRSDLRDDHHTGPAPIDGLRPARTALPASLAPDDVQPWGHPAHRHPEPQFIGAITGSAVVSVADQDFAIDPSWGVWIPAGMEHAARFDPGFVPLVRNGGPAWQTEATAVLIHPTLWRALLGAGCDLTSTADLLAEAVRHGRPGLRVPCSTTSARVTLPIVEALTADPSDDRGLDDWAALLHLSGISIRRAFQAEIGMSFTDWRTRTRLNVAVELLDAGEPVAATAKAVGLSHNGLIAAFRRHFGVTPRTVRRP